MLQAYNGHMEALHVLLQAYNGHNEALHVLLGYMMNLDVKDVNGMFTSLFPLAVVPGCLRWADHLIVLQSMKNCGCRGDSMQR